MQADDEVRAPLKVIDVLPAPRDAGKNVQIAGEVDGAARQSGDPAIAAVRHLGVDAIIDR